MADPLQIALGAIVLWAPGLAWTWALVDDIDWAKFLALSVVVALTVQPGLLYVANIFFGVAISPFNGVVGSMALTTLALAWAIRPRLQAAWA